MINHSEVLYLPRWTVRWQGVNGEGNHPVVVLLHGWTGDEDSMWIFASRLPEHTVLIAPRGFYSTLSGGYGWQVDIKTSWPSIEDLQPAVNELISLLGLTTFHGIDLSRVNLLGFSQGAALAFTFMILHPNRVQTIGSLSGFLPEDAEYYLPSSSLKGKIVFIAHGEIDELVPISRAQRSVELLMKCGAEVIFCTDNVGHKLSASCFRSMEAFYQNNI